MSRRNRNAGRGRGRGPSPRGTASRGGEPARDRVEGRNPVFELLRGARVVRRLWLDERCRPDAKLDAIVAAAADRGLEPTRLPRRELDELAEGRVHNGVIAEADPIQQPSLREVLDAIADAGVDDPLLLLLDEVQYEQNLGAILRTADAAGAVGVVVPRRRGARLSPVVQRIAMGAAEHVPVIHCGILEAMALLRRDGFRLVGADEHAETGHADADLTGPLGLVMGGEDKGLTPPVRERCDLRVRLPMRGHVPSLNVSVSVGVLLYERLRQLGVR